MIQSIYLPMSCAKLRVLFVGDGHWAAALQIPTHPGILLRSGIGGGVLTPQRIPLVAVLRPYKHTMVGSTWRRRSGFLQQLPERMEDQT